MRRWSVPALAGWSAFVWGTRIANAWGDAAASNGTKVAATALSLSVLALAAAAVLVWWRARGRPLTGGESSVWRAFAGWTAAVWLVRGVAIAVADYSTDPAVANPAGFKAVHLVLAVVSVGLGALVWRAAGPRRAPGAAERSRRADVSPPSGVAR